MELALPLLPLIAPDVAAPIAYRDGDEPPRFVQVARRRARRGGRPRGGGRGSARGTRRADRAGEAPARAAGAGRETAFDELAAPFQTLTPRAAKGLEFDRVVLVEPAAIAAEGPSGSRACARSTSRSRGRRRRSSSCTRDRFRPSCRRPTEVRSLTLAVRVGTVPSNRLKQLSRRSHGDMSWGHDPGHGSTWSAQRRQASRARRQQ